MNSSKIFIISREFSGLFFQIQTLAHFPKFWISRHAFGPSKARKVRHYFRREKSDLENKYLISLCERFRMTFKVSDKLQIQFVNFSNYEMNRKNICHEWTYKHEPFYYWEAKMNHRWQLTCKGNWTWLLALTRKHDSTSFFESLWQFYELPMQIQLLLGSKILFVLYFLESLNW